MSTEQQAAGQTGIPDLNGQPSAESVPVSTEYFTVGTPVQLTVPHKGQVQSAYSQMLGFRARRFLLVELPTVDGHAMVINPGTAVRVRYLLEGRLLGFSTASIKVQFTPERLLFLEYPKSVEQLALRRHERVRVSLPTLVRLGGRAQLQAETRDLSISGCGLLFPEDAPTVEKEKSLTVFFKMPGDSEMFKARVLTRMVAKRPDQKTWVGCEFNFQPGEEETKTMVQRMVLARTGMMSTSDLELSD